MGAIPNVSWDTVFRGFRRLRGIDPTFNEPAGWLNIAAWHALRGDDAMADACLDAGLVREAYDRDPYEPPIDLKRQYAPSPIRSEGA